MQRPSSRFISAGLIGLGLAFLNGCATNNRAAMEEARKAVPPMDAADTYFDGTLAAELSVNSAFADSAPGGGKGSGSGGGSGKHHRGGGGGMGGMHARGGGYGATDTSSEESSDAEAPEQQRSPYVESPMPPAMLRLRLENKSTQVMTVEITNLNSELGNFATRPDTFTLQPGASGEPNGMQSLLGLDTLALPVTLTLKVGGKSETKVLILRPVTPAPSAP